MAGNGHDPALRGVKEPEEKHPPATRGAAPQAGAGRTTPRRGIIGPQVVLGAFVGRAAARAITTRPTFFELVMPIAHVATGYGSSGETAVRDSDFFHVEYYCPRQAPTWQRRARPIQGYGRATAEARAIKPAAGLARVLTLAGRELYRI